jgi:hypothetical protein
MIAMIPAASNAPSPMAKMFRNVDNFALLTRPAGATGDCDTGGTTMDSRQDGQLICEPT